MADIPSWPAGFPQRSDFSASQIAQNSVSWAFDKPPGSSGGDVGEDRWATGDQILVGMDWVVQSEIGVIGHSDLRILYATQGVFNLPRGLHAGTHLAPGSALGGSGAHFHVTATMYTVSPQDWFAKAIHLAPTPSSAPTTRSLMETLSRLQSRVETLERNQ